MRKLTGILIVLIVMLIWIIGVSAIGARLSGAPRWAQLIFYILAGIGWILPLRPLFKWMNAKDTPPQD